MGEERKRKGGSIRSISSSRDIRQNVVEDIGDISPSRSLDELRLRDSKIEFRCQEGTLAPEHFMVERVDSFRFYTYTLYHSLKYASVQTLSLSCCGFCRSVDC
jgi:hypothetical protein